MAEPEEQRRLEDAQNADASGAADEEEASSPFDHPAFLPVLLWGLSIWFGYDGWINKDPEMLEHVAFNRYGFGILVVLGIYFTFQSLREARARRDGEGPKA
jgi:hypothetical protein